MAGPGLAEMRTTANKKAGRVATRSTAHPMGDRAMHARRFAASLPPHATATHGPGSAICATSEAGPEAERQAGRSGRAEPGGPGCVAAANQAEGVAHAGGNGSVLAVADE